jgi:hypothetical protein
MSIMKAYIQIKFKQPVVREAVDLGSLKIHHISGRSYMLDVDQSWNGDDDYTIEARATEDYETFPKDEYIRYDLTYEDILSTNLGALLFVDSEDDNAVESITYCITDKDGDILADNLIAAAEQSN